MFSRILFVFFLFAAALQAQNIGGGATAGGGAVLNSGSTSGGGGGGTPAISVTIVQPNQSLGVNNSLALTATVTNDPTNSGVNWSVSNPCNCANLEAVTSFISTFVAPATVPTNPVYSVTATSHQDNTKSATILITITGAVVTGPVVHSSTTTSEQVGSNSGNTFAAPNMGGDTPILVITSPDGSSITGVKEQAGNSFIDVGCQGDQTGAGHSAIFYKVGNAITISSVIVSSTGATGGNIDIGFIDATTGSTTQLDTAAVCGGSGVATGNPVGPVVTTISPNDLIVSTISVSINVQSILNPFNFLGLGRGDAAAYAVTTSAGTYSPSWTMMSGTWAGTTAAFRSGTSGSGGGTPISVSLTPASQSVQAGKNVPFTLNVINDTTNAGANYTLTGGGCSGAACGTLSVSSGLNGSNVTYTAPATVPAPPNVTLTATSVADGTKSATANITITTAPSVGITVSPLSLSLNAGGGSSSITGTVTGDPTNAGVAWTLTGSTCTGAACGAISPTSSASGSPISYTPPPSVSGSLSVTVTATAKADVTKSASTSIVVNPQATGFSCAGKPCPAFPGAQGSGATSAGGRGGTVMFVTNLNDSGAGSLRSCVAASGPRTCIFKISGRITNQSRLEVDNPYLTIAGQTAPGGPVVLASGSANGSPTCNSGTCETLWVVTHDVVVRYLTYDGSANTPTGPDTGTVGFAMVGGNGVNNIIWDHMSVRWTGNKAFVVEGENGGGVNNTTIQWSLLYEPNITHGVGIGTVYVNGNSGGCGTCTTNDDAHHMMFVTVDHRIPLNQSGRNVRWVNNLVYNWGQFAALSMGGVQTDYIGNKYVDGNGGNLNYTASSVFLGNGNGCDPNDGTGDCGGNNETGPTMYFLNNTGRTGSTRGSAMVNPTNVVNDAGQKSMTAQGWEGGQFGDSNSSGPMPSSWYRSTPLPAPQFPIVADPVSNLDSILIPTVGNSQHLDCNGNMVGYRDTQDQRIIVVYQNNLSDNLFTGQYTSPPIAAGTACPSALNDGIPDGWRNRYNEHRSANVVTASGLTVIECYLDAQVPN